MSHSVDVWALSCFSFRETSAAHRDDLLVSEFVLCVRLPSPGAEYAHPSSATGALCACVIMQPTRRTLFDGVEVPPFPPYWQVAGAPRPCPPVLTAVDAWPSVLPRVPILAFGLAKVGRWSSAFSAKEFPAS